MSIEIIGFFLGDENSLGMRLLEVRLVRRGANGKEAYLAGRVYLNESYRMVEDIRVVRGGYRIVKSGPSRDLVVAVVLGVLEGIRKKEFVG